MDNKDINNKFRALVRKTIQEGKMNEFFDDEESFGSYDGDFSSDEFSGDAMDVAKQDIGDEFEPLGSSRFEKNLNPEEFKADLTRQNLRLPNDKAEHDRIKKSIDAKKNHEKLFGVGSMNEDGEGQASKQTIKRPKDSEGNDLRINTIVTYPKTGQEGKIIRFGTTENGTKLVAQIDWFGDVVPVQGTPQTLPSKNIIPSELIIRKNEIEEGMGQSFTVGKGQNAKPSNYPENFK